MKNFIRNYKRVLELIQDKRPYKETIETGEFQKYYIHHWGMDIHSAMGASFVKLDQDKSDLMVLHLIRITYFNDIHYSIQLGKPNHRCIIDEPEITKNEFYWELEHNSKISYFLRENNFLEEFNKFIYDHIELL